MRNVTIGVRLDSLQPGGTARYIVTVKSEQSAYQTDVADIRPVLDTLASVAGFNQKLVTLGLQQSGEWTFNGAISEEIERALVDILPPRTYHVRFSYRFLSSGDLQLTCIRYGSIPAPEIPSMPHYDSLPELKAKLKEIGVSFARDDWDTAKGFYVRVDALKALGFDIQKL